MKIRAGRFLLLVLISFSLVGNDLLASSFLARGPGYGITTGHEFDQLNSQNNSRRSPKIIVVAPPPETPTGKPASATPRPPITLVQPPAEIINDKASTPAEQKTIKPPQPPRRNPPIKLRSPVIEEHAPAPNIPSPLQPAVTTTKKHAARSPKAAGPVAVSSPAPVARPVVAPVTKPVITPVARPVVAPVTKFINTPTIKPIGSTIIMPVSEPVLLPVVAPITVQKEYRPVETIVQPMRQPVVEKPAVATVVSVPSATPAVDDDELVESVAGAKDLGAQVVTEAAGAGSSIYGLATFDSGLHVEATSDLQSVFVEPGRSFTLSFRVTNMSGKPGNFVEEFAMPPGFALTFPAAEFSLAHMESFNSIVMVTAPAYLSAGEHQFTYNVFDPDNQGVHGSLSFRFQIKEMVDLKFVVEEQPKSIMGGESFTVKGKLLNNSNATFSLGLSLSQQEHFKVSVTPDRALLAPGSFVELEMNGQTIRNTKLNKTISFTLAVADLAKRDRPVLMRQNIGINFFTRASTRVDFRNRLPVVGTMYFSGDKDDSARQFEIRGKGNLDSTGRRKIDFLVREKAPRQHRFSSLRREEARAHFTSETVGVKLGDHNFGVSPLSKYYNGKGVGIDIARGQRTSFGAIDYQRSWSATPLHGRGFYLAHILNDKTTLKFNHLSTNSDKFAASPDEKFSTLSFTHQPMRNSMLKGEIARKWGGELSDRRNAAFSIDYTATVKEMATINLSHSDTGVIYAGEMVGNENSNSSINLYLNKQTNLNAYYQQTKQNPLIKDATVAAIKQSNFQAGIDRRLSRYNSLSLSYFNLDTEDWLNDSYESNEHGIMARFTQNWQKSGFNYSLYRKKNSDLQLGFKQWNTVHRANSYIRTNKMLLNFYVAKNIHNSDFGSLLNDNNSYGIGMNWAVMRYLKMKFNYNHTDYAGNSPDRAFWSFNLNYEVNDSIIDLSLKQQKIYALQDDLIYYELAMSKKIGIAVSRSIAKGALAGHLLENVGSETRPLVNATLLLNNFAAVTDRAGKFTFADLKPGTYTLDLVADRKSSFVTSISLPTSVYIAGGRLAVLDIQLEAACRVVGAVSVNNEAITDELVTGSSTLTDRMPAPMPLDFRPVDSAMLYGIIILFEKDDEHFSARTGSDGRFYAGNFKAGNWQYQVLQSSLPQGYKIDKAVGEVELANNTEATLNFLLTPVVRTIEFVSE